jgi:hypothetical protein
MLRGKRPKPEAEAVSRLAETHRLKKLVQVLEEPVPDVSADVVPPRSAAEETLLRERCAELERQIALEGRPAGSTLVVQLFDFCVRLRGVSLEERELLVSPAVFALVTDILSLTPPRDLVDALCAVLANVLLADADIGSGSECNTALAERICTPQLAGALKTVLECGLDYLTPNTMAAVSCFACLKGAPHQTLVEAGWFETLMNSVSVSLSQLWVYSMCNILLELIRAGWTEGADDDFASEDAERLRLLSESTKLEALASRWYQSDTGDRIVFLVAALFRARPLPRSLHLFFFILIRTLLAPSVTHAWFGRPYIALHQSAFTAMQQQHRAPTALDALLWLVEDRKSVV